MEALWGALFGGAITLITTLVTNFYADKRARRQEQLTREEWERSDIKRREDTEREDKLRQEQMRHQADQSKQQRELERQKFESEKQSRILSECWENITTSKMLLLDLVDAIPRIGEKESTAKARRTKAAFESHLTSPVFYASRAYAFALQGQADVYPLVRSYYEVVAKLQLAVEGKHYKDVGKLAHELNVCFESLEKTIARLNGVIPTLNNDV